MALTLPEFSTLIAAVDSGVALVTLNRPDRRNALDRVTKEELRAAIEFAGETPEIRAVVLTGAGKGFCAGQDLDEPGDAPIDVEAEVRDAYNPLILAIRDLEKPVVAAINGVAAGAGFSLALACDIRIAAEAALFVAGFGAIGLVPDSGMSWFLPRIVGPGRAAEILLAGGRIGATEAEAIGLVNRVVPAERLIPEALALGERLAAAAPLATALTKRALNLGLETGLREALDVEAQFQGIAGRSDDFAEGLAAFREKRPARFSGR